MTDAAPASPPGAPPEQQSPQTTRVNWDDRDMHTSFANVINVLSTREEFQLLFGTNETWNPAGAQGLTVKLRERVVLTPYGAKRLYTLLGQQLGDYEQRFGQLRLDT
jgi:hypothetical protein